MYYTSGIVDPTTNDFINRACSRFLKRVGSIGASSDFGKYLYRFTEASFVNIFIECIHREFGFDRYEIITELGVRKDGNKYGRIDLIITDKENKHRYILECKSLWSIQNEPNSEYWGATATEEWYKKTFSQAIEYLAQEEFLKSLPIQLISLTFARVAFTDDSKQNSWRYDTNHSDEFFGIEMYPFDIPDMKEKSLGIAIYGKVKEFAFA